MLLKAYDTYTYYIAMLIVMIIIIIEATLLKKEYHAEQCHGNYLRVSSGYTT
jgi:hypothetical protein